MGGDGDRDGMVKLAFVVEDEAGGRDVETLWASPIGDGTYVLENSPFSAYGSSWQDVVEAAHDVAEGGLAFRRTVKKSGHRTVRVIVERPDEADRRVHRPMKALGCSVESATPALFAVDVPPEADLGAVARALTDAGTTWEHADPTYEELYGDDEDGDEDDA